MATCPSCKTELGDDFGLVECPSCHKVSFVELDGSIAAPLPAHEVEIATADESGALFEDPSEMNGPSDLISAAEVSADHAVSVASSVDVEIEDEPHEVDEPMETIESTDSLDSRESVDGPSDRDPIGLGDFANADQTPGRDGNLRYNLTVTGIDTADLRVELLAALSDKRFLLDPQTLIKTVKNGELKIDNLSAVKTALLVAMLRPLPLRLKWEQHAIYQD